MKKYILVGAFFVPLFWFYENPEIVDTKTDAEAYVDAPIFSDKSEAQKGDRYTSSSDERPGVSDQSIAQSGLSESSAIEVKDLKQLKKSYIDLQDDEIEEEIAVILAEIESDELISKSNSESLDVVGRQRLSNLLQQLDALRLVKVRRKMDRLRKLAAKPLDSRSENESWEKSN